MKKELEPFMTRYSCRNFKDEALKMEDLRDILEVARLSPSSLALEPWNFFVVQDKTQKSQIAKIAKNQVQVAKAAALIIIVSRFDFVNLLENKLKNRNLSQNEFLEKLSTYKPFLEAMNEEQKRAYAKEQAHIALGSILYSANALKIATCTIGGFDKDELNSYLKLDKTKEFASLIIALGKSADEKISPKQRKEFDEVVKFI